MADSDPGTSQDASDGALVARLYELASARSRGSPSADREELARIDAIVYRRLARAYGSEAPQKSLAAYRLDS